MSAVAKLIFNLLKEKGYSSTRPIGIKEEDLKRPPPEEWDWNTKDFIIEMRAAQKVMYMTTILSDILEKCESPFEERLARGLVEENIPFVQHYEVTKSFPMRGADGKDNY